MSGRGRWKSTLASVLCSWLLACAGDARGSIGVLARMDAHDRRVVVVDVPPGLAGARAGLEVGDEILEVDQVPAATMTREDFQRAVRGSVGSVVTLTVLRSGRPQRVRVERTALRSPTSGG